MKHYVFVEYFVRYFRFDLKRPLQYYTRAIPGAIKICIVKYFLKTKIFKLVYLM